MNSKASSSFIKNDNNMNTSKEQGGFNKDYGQNIEYYRRKKRKRFPGASSQCPCSLLRIFLTALILALIGATIVAITITISSKWKATTKSTTTTTTTVTTTTMTTTTTTTTTTTATTTTTTTTTTTITTTTTTQYICNTTCVNQTWLSTTNLTAQWLFDQTFTDQQNIYNATSLNNVSFTSKGYVEQAAVFTLNLNQSLIAPYIAFTGNSFTVEMWLYITAFTGYTNQAIFGLCTANTLDHCLHLTIRLVSSDYYLYLGFFNDDCQGSTPVGQNTWMHAAFVFNKINLKQYVYLNGVLDKTCDATSALQLNSDNVTIGSIPLLSAVNQPTFFLGYIDQLTVSLRVKPACEILEDATLSTRFTFDTGLLFTDSGPNNLPATTQSTSSTPTGHFAQALTLSGSSSSYFQISDITSLGISNRAFSISFWIRPVSLSGVLVHVSSNASGTDWCLPFLGFANNGSLVAQILNTNGVVSISDPSLSVLTSTWSQIVQTWSSTNGLRLYINNILVASRTTQATTYTASGVSNYVTIGNVLNGNICNQGAIGALTSYQGDIDDFRVYSRELTGADVCTLYVS